MGSNSFFKNSIGQKFSAFTYLLFSFALLVSLGALEMVSSLAAVVGLAVLFSRQQGDEFKWSDLLKTWPVIFSGLFFISASLSALFGPLEENVLDAIGSNRGLLLIPVLSFVWQKQFVNINKTLLYILFFTGSMASVYSFYQFFTGVDLMRPNNFSLEPIGPFFRTAGFFGLPLTFAYSLGMVFFLLLPLPLSNFFKQSSQVFKSCYYISIILMCFALFSTNVRGAWLAFVITFLFFLTNIESKKTKYVVAGSFFVGIGSLFFLEAFRDRLFSIVDLTNLSNMGRFTIWKSTFLLWLENPWLGVGLGQSDNLVGSMYDKYNFMPPDLGKKHHAHNDFLQILCGTGVVGFTLFISFLGSFIRMSYTSYKALLVPGRDKAYLFFGCLLALIYISLGSMTQCNYTDREVNHMITFIMCIILCNFVALRGSENKGRN